jgi:hypothetical protein
MRVKGLKYPLDCISHLLGESLATGRDRATRSRLVGFESRGRPKTATVMSPGILAPMPSKVLVPSRKGDTGRVRDHGSFGPSYGVEPVHPVEIGVPDGKPHSRSTFLPEAETFADRRLLPTADVDLG